MGTAASCEDERPRASLPAPSRAGARAVRAGVTATALAAVALLSGGSAGATDLVAAPQELVRPANLALLGGGGAVAAVAHRWDDDLRAARRDLWGVGLTARVTDVYAASPFGLLGAAGLWAAGRGMCRPGLTAAGGDLAASLGAAQVLVGPLKLAAGRRRPDGSDRRSFPSGHAANAFAVARIVQGRAGNRPGLSLYALAALTAAGRVEGDKHYLSDVVAGGVLGVVAANCALAARPDRAWTVAPVGTAGLAIGWRW